MTITTALGNGETAALVATDLPRLATTDLVSNAVVFLKRGESFTRRLTFTEDGQPMSIAGWVFTSEARDDDSVLIATATFSERDDAGGAITVDLGSTSGWEIGRTVHWDCRIVTDSAQVLYTETVDIRVLRSETGAVP